MCCELVSQLNDIPDLLCRERSFCIEPALPSVREHASCMRYARLSCGSVNTHKHTDNHINLCSQCVSVSFYSWFAHLVNSMQRARVVDSHTLGRLHMLTDAGEVQWGTPLLQGQTSEMR